MNLHLPESFMSNKDVPSICRLWLDPPVDAADAQQFSIADSRERWISKFRNLVEFMIQIGEEDDEDDDQKLPTKVAAAKESLLRCISHILPEGDEFYRPVLQHGDFSSYNASVFVEEGGQIKITSVFDWQRGCIVPLILSELKTRADLFDFTMDEDGKPLGITRANQMYTSKWQNDKVCQSLLMAVSPRCVRELLTLRDQKKVWGLFLQVMTP